MVLYLSTKIDVEKEIIILCAGTDCTDGSTTDATGAVVGGHIITGNTGTNVMDMVVVVMKK
jgi:hydroxypyruvate reductase/glycerate 2-kinase